MSASPRGVLVSALATCQAHLSHRSNAPLLPRLLRGARAMGDCYEQLLRLLCAPLFTPEAYRLGERIARGAFGAVCGCALQPSLRSAPPLAVKLVSAAKSRYASSNLPELCAAEQNPSTPPLPKRAPPLQRLPSLGRYAELLVLLRLRREAQATRLYDFGFDGSQYWLVMRRRSHIRKPCPESRTLPAPARPAG